MPDSPPPPATARLGNRRGSARPGKDRRKVSANNDAVEAAEIVVLVLRGPRAQALAALEAVLATPGVELARLVRPTEADSRRRARSAEAPDFAAILRGEGAARPRAAVRAAVLPTRGAQTPRCVRACVLPLRSAGA